MGINEVSSDSCQKWPTGEEEGNTCKNPYNCILDIDIEGLSEEQYALVRKMLEEEAESFSKTNDHVRTAEGLQVEINLTDSVPVHKKICIYS